MISGHPLAPFRAELVEMSSGYSAKNGASGGTLHSGIEVCLVSGVKSPFHDSQDDDYPIVCETCLGSNPYLRMTKKTFGDKLCKISQVPFQGYKWKAGPAGRFRETIVCKEVAVDKNICQSCLNDMKYGLPVGVRDAMLTQPVNMIAMPESAVGQKYYHQQVAQSSSVASTSSQDLALQLANVVPDRQLDRFSRIQQAAAAAKSSSSTSFRNLPKLCSFWLNGRCERVKRKTCPFRPCCGAYAFPEIASSRREVCRALVAQLEAEGPAAVMTKLSKETLAAFRESMKGNKDEAIRKRVSGEDELSQKYVARIKGMNSDQLAPPSDPSITTLFLGGIDEDISEEAVRAAVYPFGLFSNVHVSRASKCAFVDYIDRPTAEYAASQMHNSLSILGRPINVKWGKARAPAAPAAGAAPVVFVPAAAAAAAQYPPGAVVWGMMPPPGMEWAPQYAYGLQGLAQPLMTVAGPPAPPLPPGALGVGQVRPRDEGKSGSAGGGKRAAVEAEGGRQYITSFSSSGAGAAAAAAARPPPPASYPSMNPARMGSKL